MNEAVVEEFFRDFSDKGVIESVRKHGADEFSFWLCGMGDITEQLPMLSQAFKLIFENGMVIRPDRMISDGNFVAVEASTDSRLRDGTEYRNTLSYWIELSGRKIVSCREYSNRAYGDKVIGSDLAAALAELREDEV